MNCSYNSDRHGERSVSPLLVCDLRAQLAPLNRYGPSGLGVAFADGLHALIGVSRKAVGAALTRPSRRTNSRRKADTLASIAPTRS